MLLGSDLYELDEEEAQKLGDAMERVQRLYSKSILSESAAAWVNLAMVSAGIVGPRVMAAKRRPAEGRPVAGITQ